MGAGIFPASAGGAAFVCKQSVAGQLALPTAAGAAVSLTAGRDTWGSWAQVVSSSAAEYYLTGVTAWGGLNRPSHHLRVQVGIGAAGAESVLGEVVVPPLADNSYNSPVYWQCSGTQLFVGPLRVPISTRIAVRGLAWGASSSLGASVMVLAVPYTSIEGN